MKTLTIRSLPDDLLRDLKRLAARNHRSLQQQVLMLLEQARSLSGDSPVERAREMRARLSGRELGDAVAEQRQERAR